MELESIYTLNSTQNSHMCIKQKEEMRYIIQNTEIGKKTFLRSFNPYSTSKKMLKFGLSVLPTSLLCYTNFCINTGLSIHTEIMSYIKEILGKCPQVINILIGTYDEYQKVIIQANIGDEIIYLKIGDIKSAILMNSEINFYKKKEPFNSFDIPEYISSKESEQQNILVTRHFEGTKQKPAFDDILYKCWREISSVRDTYEINSIRMSFSHGDFAPWNIVIRNGKPLIFDWEYCGLRFYGFDLIHYNFQIERLSNGRKISEALTGAIHVAQKYDQYLGNIKEKKLINLYVHEMDKRGIDLTF